MDDVGVKLRSLRTQATTPYLPRSVWVVSHPVQVLFPSNVIGKPWNFFITIDGKSSLGSATPTATMHACAHACAHAKSVNSTE